MEQQSGASVLHLLHEREVLGDYEIVGVAGTGGMGVVYKARQRSLGRTVALKVIREDIARTSEYRQRFLREAGLAASVDHPHVVSIYEVSDAEHQLFLAMQWIDGQDLNRLLEKDGRLAADRAVAIATQLAGALDAVHGVAGLIHRDVKPANVLLRQVSGIDHAYLTDFGVAKPAETGEQLTQTGWIVGTTGYLSPEQIRGQEPGPSSDLYALGCLFFETLTGQPPFRGDNEMALRWAHANDPRPIASTVLPALGDRYDRFFAIALAVDPAQRFRSGREFASSLASAHAGEWTTAAHNQPITPAHTPTAVGPPTPIPPANTPAPGAQPYPATGYATPPPSYPQPSRSGNPLALILLGLVALAGIAVGALAAAGVFSHSTTTRTITDATHAHARTKGATAINHHARVGAGHSSGGVGPAVPAGARTSCGGDLSVGPNTSCGFAQNVENTYDQTSGGDQVVTAFSPETGTSYTINCSGGTPHVCTGGTTHDASVYFTSGPSSAATTTSAPPSSSTPTNLHACDQNISASANTSCQFAENVFYEYTQSPQDPSGQSMTIYSPATNSDYSVTCTPDQQSNVECYSNTGSYTTFSQASVGAYTPAEAAAYARSANLGNSNPNG
jgi:serine/threonine protein kinase